VQCEQNKLAEAVALMDELWQYVKMI
jgi:hypothetical protein